MRLGRVKEQAAQAARVPTYTRPLSLFGGPFPAQNMHQVVHQGGESLAAALERLTNNILKASTQVANRSAALEVRCGGGGGAGGAYAAQLGLQLADD